MKCTRGSTLNFCGYFKGVWLGLFLLIAANTSHATSSASFVVNTATDAGTSTGVGSGTTGDLRYCVNAANVAGGTATITFDPTVFATAQTITLLVGQLELNANITITGPGVSLLTVSGNNASRVFQVDSTRTCTISNMTITGGNGVGALSSGKGGGILNAGTLTVLNCVVTGNATPTSEGGGINNSGTVLNVTNSTISNNTASFTGGGLVSRSGTVTITSSTVSNNTVTGATASAGGGMEADCALTVINSTFSGNHADNCGINSGGGLYCGANVVTITSCTFTGNSAKSSGTAGGLRNDGATSVTVSNTIIAGNTGSSSAKSDVSGAFTSSGYNLIGDGTGSTGFTGTADQVGTTGSPINAQLGALSDNGGPTQTHALMVNSPAIDAGKSFTLTTDQRGFVRPVDFGSVANASGGDGSDIGAFEISSLAAITVPGGTLSLPATVLGTAGSFAQFNFSGSNLTGGSGNITITAPTNVEVSSDGTTFGPTCSVPYMGTSLSASPVYARLKGTGTVGNISGSVSLSGGGATTTQAVLGLLTPVGTVAAIQTANVTNKITFTPGFISNGNSGTLGWTFTLGANDILVNALGTYDNPGTGLLSSHSVGIWDKSGTLVTSVTVNTGQLSPYNAGYRYEVVNSARLLAGQTYTIGTFYPAGCGEFLLYKSAQTFAPQVTLGKAVQSGPSAGLTFMQPTSDSSGVGSPGFFGPNFLFQAPVVTVSGGTLTLPSTKVGSSGASVSYTLSGSTLTPLSGSINATAPANVEISSDNITFSPSLTFNYSNGALASTTVYARLTGTGTPGTISGNITHSGGGAGPAPTKAVSGQLSADTTTAAANATVVFSSAAQNVTLNATVSSTATVSEGTVTFQLKSGSTLVGSAVTSGTVSNGVASVSYALPAGTAVGVYSIVATYHATSNYLTSADDTHTLTISAVPALTLPDGALSLPATKSKVAGASVSYSFSGSGLSPLTGSITVTAPANVEISSDNTTFGPTLNFPYASGTLSATTVYVRLAGTGTPGTISGNIAHSGGGVSPAPTKAVSGQLNEDQTTPPPTPNATTTVAANATVVFSASAQNVALSATVSSTATVNEGTVTFQLSSGSTLVGSAVTSGTVSNGAASVSYSLPAGTAVGSYTIVATFNATSNFLTSADSAHTLTVSAAPVVPVATVAKFSVTATPSAIFVGDSVSVKVVAQDASGATVSTYSGTVHFSSSDAKALLPAYATLTSGVGTFSVTLTTPGSQTITATDTATPAISGVSSAVTVNARQVIEIISTDAGDTILDIPGTFSAAASKPDAIFTWDFGDGSPTVNGSTVNHIYSVGGTYTVTITVTDPTSGATSKRTVTIVVSDIQTAVPAPLNGTLGIKIKHGKIRIYPSFLKLSGSIPFPSGTQVGGSTLTLSVNGLNRTFTLNDRGMSSDKNGSLRFSTHGSKSGSGATDFNIFLHGDDLGKALATNVGLDAKGRPKKALIQMTLKNLTGSYVTPLNYQTPDYPGFAKFGQK